MLRENGTHSYRRGGNILVQDGDVRGNSQECSCLRVFGTDRVACTIPMNGSRLEQAPRSPMFSIVTGFRDQQASRVKGISPLQLWESREVGVRRTEFTTVCHGKCSEVSICDKIPQCLSLGEHLPEDLPMPLRWVNQSGTRLVNPALHSVNGLIEGQRLRKHPCVGADPDKR